MSYVRLETGLGRKDERQNLKNGIIAHGYVFSCLHPLIFRPSSNVFSYFPLICHYFSTDMSSSPKLSFMDILSDTDREQIQEEKKNSGSVILQAFSWHGFDSMEYAGLNDHLIIKKQSSYFSHKTCRSMDVSGTTDS